MKFVIGKYNSLIRLGFSNRKLSNWKLSNTNPSNREFLASPFIASKAYSSTISHKVHSSFDTFPELHGDLKTALKSMGIETPTEIQQRALSPVLKGESAFISSECGSGKSLIFLLPIVQRCLAERYNTQRPGFPLAFILLPSLELAQQVKAMLIRLSLAVDGNRKDPWLTVNCITDLEKREFMMYWELLRDGQKTADVFRKSFNHYQRLLGEDTETALREAYKESKDDFVSHCDKITQRCPMVVIATPGVFLSHASDSEIFNFLHRIPILAFDEMDQLLLQTGIGVKYLEMIKKLKESDFRKQSRVKLILPEMSLAVRSIVFHDRFMNGKVDLPAIQRQYLLSSATIPPNFMFTKSRSDNKLKKSEESHVSTSPKTAPINMYESSMANVSIPRNQIFIDIVDERAKVEPTNSDIMVKKLDELYPQDNEGELSDEAPPKSDGSKRLMSSNVLSVDADGIPYLPGINESRRETFEYLWNKRLEKLTDILSSYTESDTVPNKTVLVFASKADQISKIQKSLTNSMSDLINKRKVQIFALTKDINEYDRMFILKPFLRFLYIPSTDVTNQSLYSNRKILKEPATLAPLNVLILTDGFSRGLDFKRVDYVIQFDFAVNCIDYLHRTGRTARAGSFEGQEQKILADAIKHAVQRGEENISKLDSEFSRMTKNLIRTKKLESRIMHAD